MPYWHIRLWLLKNCSDLPGGHTLYRFLQTRSRFHTSTDRFEKKRDQALHIVDVAERSGVSMANATVVEIGTGWVPLLPAIAWLLGADRVYTVDLNRHLLHSAARRVLRWLVDSESSLRELQVRGDSRVVQERAGRLRACKDPLSIFGNTDLIYQAPCDARQLELPDSSVDLVCSNVTLENIPKPVLEGIFCETARLLKPNGRAVHRVDLSDHCSHSDRSISRVNFLRYSDDQWLRMAGQGICYHNRLRAPEYRDLVRSSQLELELFEQQFDRRSLEDLKDFCLAEERWSQ